MLLTDSHTKWHQRFVKPH